MAKFRQQSMRDQAEAFISSKTTLNQPKNSSTLSSIRTASEYKRDLIRAAESIQKEHGIKRLSEITPSMALEHLEQRADIIGQKALDNERLSLQMLNQPGYALENHKIERIIAEGGHNKYPGTRAYTNDQIELITQHQQPHNSLSTQIAYAAGLRQHELFTLNRVQEQPASSHRKWRSERFQGRDGVIYTVKGKGGLIREVIIPHHLANQLEKLRLNEPIKTRDREINYLKHYHIGAGQAWAKSFREAAKRGYGSHKGAHGVRHSYAQQRMAELRTERFSYKQALAIVSQELGHFRPEITEVYLR